MVVILTSIALVSCYNETNALTDCYKIAKENGYSGSVDDFTNIIKALGTDAKDIKSMTLDGNRLKLTLKDGTTQSIDLTPRDGIDGNDGKDGADGLTPHIGENGNWWIGDKDTGIQAVDNTTYTVKLNSDKSIRIPDTIETIGQWAFDNCYSLETITLPDNARFSSDAFAACPLLKEINISVNNAYYKNIDGVIYDRDMTRLHRSVPLSGIKKLIVPDTVKTISRYAFNGSDIEEIILPNGLTTIDHRTFSGSAIKNINIPETVTTIKSSAFSGCKNLTEITLPKNLTTLGESAFSQCRALKTITLPEGITTLAESMFSQCSSLQTIENIENITYFGTAALSSCPSLVIPKLSDDLTYIGEYAFYRSASIPSLLPSKLEYIGRNAFDGNKNITTLIIPKSVAYIGNEAFYQWNETQSIKFVSSESASSSWDIGWKSDCKAQIIWDYQP